MLTSNVVIASGPTKAQVSAPSRQLRVGAGDAVGGSEDVGADDGNASPADGATVGLPADVVGDAVGLSPYVVGDKVGLSPYMVGGEVGLSP